MWRMIQEQLQPGSSDQYRIAADDGSILNYAQVIEHWGNDTGFAMFFSKQLAASALSDQPLWVSTCGLGVYWLHVRLDSFPKYYRYAPYQTFS